MPKLSGEHERGGITARLAAWSLIRGRRLAALAALLAVVCVVWAWGMRLSENIVDMLPREDPAVAGFLELVNRFDMLDYMYFDIGPSDPDAPVPLDQLVDAADALFRAIDESGRFKRTTYHWLPGDAQRARAYILRHRDSLFTADDQVAIAEKLKPEAIERSLRQWRRRLTESPAPFLAEAFYEDPLGVNAVFESKLRAAGAVGVGLDLHDGRLVTADRRHVVGIALPRCRATDSRRSEDLIAFVRRVATEIEQRDPKARIHIAYFGGHRASLDNARQIEGDIKRAITLSALGIAVLSALAFGRRRLVVLAFVPVAFGGVFAVGVMRWVAPSISAITIGCGAMLMGISIDYAIHVLYGLDSIRPDGDLRAQSERVVSRLIVPVVLSAGTTLAAFGVLNLSALPGYRELGRFAALGILGAVGFSVLVLPWLGQLAVARGGRRPLWDLPNVLMPVVDSHARRGVWIRVSVLVGVSVAATWGLTRLTVEGDVRRLNAVTDQTQADWDRLTSALGDAMSTTAFAVRAADLDAALTRNEQLAALLMEAMRDDRVRAVSGLAGLFPSAETQSANRDRWTSFWTDQRRATLRERVRTAARAEGMHPEVFDGFLNAVSVPAPSVHPGDCQTGLLADLLAAHVSIDSNGATVLTRVTLAEDASFDRIVEDVIAAVPGAVAFDGRSMVTHVAHRVYSEMARLGAVTIVVVAVLVAVAVRRCRLVVAMLIPVLVGAWWTLGLLGLLAVPLNVANSAVAVFVLGLVADYAIFLTLAIRSAADEALRRTCGAVAISALTTLCGMGVLVVARHPALHAIGATAVLGVACGLAAVLTIVPWIMATAPAPRAYPA